jgi:hypothetical protein
LTASRSSGYAAGCEEIVDQHDALARAQPIDMHLGGGFRVLELIGR